MAALENALKFLSGFETGQVNDWVRSSGTVAMETTTVNSGAYSLRVNPTTTAVGYVEHDLNDPASNNDTLTARFYFRYATKPTAGNEELFFGTGGGTAVDAFGFRLDSDGHINLYSHPSGGGYTLRASGTTALSVDTWYLIDVFIEITAGATADQVVLQINGVEEFNTTYVFATGSSEPLPVFLGKRVDINGQTVDFFFDDFRCERNQDTTPTFFGEGKIIARSPETGTPTHDAWDKSTGSDAWSLWDGTPPDGATFCESPGSGDPLAQTAHIAAFDSTQTGHGSETISGSDTLNAASVVAAAYRQNGAARNHELRRIINSNTTDSVIGDVGTGAGSDVQEEWWTTDLTLTNLNAMEAGGYKYGGAGGRDLGIYDLWVMVDYTPSPAVAPDDAATFSYFPDRARTGSRGPVNTSGMTPSCHDDGEAIPI